LAETRALIGEGVLSPGKKAMFVQYAVRVIAQPPKGTGVYPSCPEKTEKKNSVGGIMWKGGPGVRGNLPGVWSPTPARGNGIPWGL